MRFLRRIYERLFVSLGPQAAGPQKPPIYQLVITHTAGVHWQAESIRTGEIPNIELLQALCCHVCYLSQAMNLDPEVILDAARDEINSPDTSLRVEL